MQCTSGPAPAGGPVVSLQESAVRPGDPHLPFSLTSVSHRGSQAPLLCPRPDPGSEPPGLKAFQDFYLTVGLPEDTAVTLPKSGTRRAPSCGKPRPPSPAPPPFRSPGRHRQEVAFSSKDGLAALPGTLLHTPPFPLTHMREMFGTVGARGPHALGGAVLGRSQEQVGSPSQPSLSQTLCLSTDACSSGERKHADSSGDPPWPFLGGGQGRSPLPSSRACACGLPLLAMPPARSPSEGCRCRSRQHPLFCLDTHLCAPGLSLHITSSREPLLIT